MVATDEALVSECIELVCVSWVESWRDALRRDGRRMRGGWPGTRAEARARIVQRLIVEAARRGRPLPGSDRIERAAAELYAAARRAWLAEASGGEDDDDAEA